MKSLKTKKEGALNIFSKSFKDYKLLFSVFWRDLLFILFLLIILAAYTVSIMKYLPQNPGFTQQSIMFASEEAIDALNSSLNMFLNVFWVSSIISVLLILAAFSVIKESVWTKIVGQKFSFKQLWKVLSLNLIMYIISGLITFVFVISSGFLMQTLAKGGAGIYTLQSIAIFVLIILTPIILQLINFSSYSFAGKRKFFRSIVDAFKSFSKIHKMLLPYLLLILVFTVFGLLGNLLLYLVANNPFLSVFFSIIVLLILIAFISWQKIYSYLVFEKVYR